jgi:DNA-binding HxlR family transcriptional regulator
METIRVKKRAAKIISAPILPCPVTTALSAIGGKWKPAILWQIRHGVIRFGALQRSLGGVTQKMLTQQLRALEAEGILVRRVYPEVPPRVEYTLSDYGWTLQPMLDTMAEWGRSHQSRKPGSQKRR